VDNSILEQHRFTWTRYCAFATFMVTALASGGCAPVETAGAQLRIISLSGRPDMVSGGDVLVRIKVPYGVPIDTVSVRVEGRDATERFRPRDDGSLEGLVTDLPSGTSVLSVTSGAGAQVSMEFSNHPLSGPVFSGPHQWPFVCETDRFELPSGETLGQALDDDCGIVRRVDYLYRAKGDSRLKSLDDPTIRPDDLFYTVTMGGERVPYLVRIETGTINRAIYQIALLHDPLTEPEPDPWQSPAGWNGRLIYTFGGGCVNGWYRQGARTGGVVDDVMLRQGYAVASSTLNVFGNNCNDLLAAESMMMVKERFIEAYGQPNFTIGWGCSGGSYQNHQIADNYPGLLDGIIPGCSFPDVISGTIPFVTDARLLNHYFAKTAPGLFSEKEQQAVTGFLVLNTMSNVSRNAGRISPVEFCPEVLPEELRYNRDTNPGGARCDVYDHGINVFGRDPDTGFALRPLDNVGVQYGLQALNAGAITTEQFLDLNERIGGYDRDGMLTNARTVADLAALRAAYETGRVTHGGGGLASIPIIDYRGYSDDMDRGDVHVRYHSFSMRDRLLKANGRSDNHVMLVEDNRHGLYSTKSPVAQEALRQMDVWLSNLAGQVDAEPTIEDVVRAKPVDLVDACWSRGENPTRIAETQKRDKGRCSELFPAPPAPREVAGGPIGSEILKCQLRSIDLLDYEVSFSAEELSRLQEIFGAGVCDWEQPGVEQTEPLGTWLTLNVT